MTNIPEFLIDMLNKQYGEEQTNSILQGYTKKRPITIRINTLKTNRDIIENILKQKEITYRTVAFYEDAYILENISKEEIIELEIYKNGEIYLQSLSSMLPPIVLAPGANMDILDMCAAPRRKNNTACLFILQPSTHYSM